MNRRCANESDELNYFLEKMMEADGIIIGSPTYFAAWAGRTGERGGQYQHCQYFSWCKDNRH